MSRFRPLGQDDCLAWLLVDLLGVDLATLPRTLCQPWLQTAALCVGKIAPIAMRPSWLDLLAAKIVLSFPGYRGGIGAARRDLERLMHEMGALWPQWAQIYAPPLPVGKASAER